MQELKSQVLFTIDVAVDVALEIGQTPAGKRHVVSVKSGRFEGSRLAGNVLPASGGDWLVTRADNALCLDARLVLQTDDQVLILMTYRGIRHGPPEVLKRLADGKTVDPSQYYFRATPYFETASSKYDWLNRITAVAVGERKSDRVKYTVYEIL